MYSIKLRMKDIAAIPLSWITEEARLPVIQEDILDAFRCGEFDAPEFVEPSNTVSTERTAL